jgi:polyhydroxyalkanoate synthase
VIGILTSAMSPTNMLAGNPAALKRAFETGGLSLVRGTKNLVNDLRHNDGMPAQVKRSDFKLGMNIAATPGAVVLRTERFELRYQATTAKVREIPARGMDERALAVAATAADAHSRGHA